MAAKPKFYRSLIGGALENEGFEIGDLIPVPAEKEKLWLDLGLIELVKTKPASLSASEAAGMLEED